MSTSPRRSSPRRRSPRRRSPRRRSPRRRSPIPIRNFPRIYVEQLSPFENKVLDIYQTRLETDNDRIGLENLINSKKNADTFWHLFSLKGYIDNLVDSHSLPKSMDEDIEEYIRIRSHKNVVDDMEEIENFRTRRPNERGRTERRPNRSLSPRRISPHRRPISPHRRPRRRSLKARS